MLRPAGPAKWEPVRKYAEVLRKAGYKVRVPEDVADRELGYLAGTDDQRVAELNAMIRDPDVRAIFPVRGGYGTDPDSGSNRLCGTTC